MTNTHFDSTVVSLPAQETEHDQIAHKVASYEAVRFNAVKHGILSRLVVLPHEDAGEFADLLAALVMEHQPAGATEMHLVEELAGTIWRKRRVLMAEGAQINRGLQAVMKSDLNSPIPAAAPLQRGLSSRINDLSDLINLTPDENAASLRDAELDVEASERAWAVLRRGGAQAYKKALQALLPHTRDWFDEQVDDGEHTADAEGLHAFLIERIPTSSRLMEEYKFQSAIQAQTFGEGLQPHRLEKLNRYETHIDRKFERTLAMLLKMKELRSGR